MSSLRPNASWMTTTAGHGPGEAGGTARYPAQAPSPTGNLMSGMRKQCHTIGFGTPTPLLVPPTGRRARLAIHLLIKAIRVLARAAGRGCPVTAQLQHVRDDLVPGATGRR